MLQQARPAMTVLIPPATLPIADPSLPRWHPLLPLAIRTSSLTAPLVLRRHNTPTRTTDVDWGPSG